MGEQIWVHAEQSWAAHVSPAGHRLVITILEQWWKEMAIKTSTYIT